MKKITALPVLLLICSALYADGSLCADAGTKPMTMCDFYFGIGKGLYSLQFRTLYYKSGGVKMEPPIQYSVYCRESADPVVKEYVEMLLRLAP